MTRPARHLADYLPEIYHADELLLRLAEVLERPQEELRRQIDRLPALYDPERTPEQLLDFLGRLVGLPNDEGRFTAAQMRRLIPQAASLQRRKGTRSALEELLATVVLELCGEEVALRVIEQADWETLPPPLAAAAGGARGREEDLVVVLVGFHPRLCNQTALLEALAREYAPAFARVRVELLTGEARPDTPCYLDYNCYL